MGGVLAAPFGGVLVRRVAAKFMLILVGLTATSTDGFVRAIR